jgi:hypothetical protein
MRIGTKMDVPERPQCSQNKQERNIETTHKQKTEPQGRKPKCFKTRDIQIDKEITGFHRKEPSINQKENKKQQTLLDYMTK